MNLFNYILSNSHELVSLSIEHIKLTAIAVSFAILIGVPLGILISYVKKLNKPILGIANVAQAIPSMALLGFMIPFFGIGAKPAIIVVIIYSLLPIIKNTFTGINNINPQTIESARAIGLTKFQVLTKVQIPMALPLIMAGVRISSVTAVGLMTMAAFIGAGGLGSLVFAGIRTVNNTQILAGAIPACILALLVDFVTSIVERLVTPINIQLSKDSFLSSRKIQKSILVVTLLTVLFSFGYTYFNNRIVSDKVITVGTKDYTEQHILGNLVSQMIEGNTDITVDTKVNLGGTKVCFGALQQNEIDMYMEYTGTAYTDLLKKEPISDVEKVYNTVKTDLKTKFNLEVLDPFSFNNTYVIAISKEDSKKYGIENVSDFAKHSNKFVMGSTYEFLNRIDGLKGLEKAYGFTMQKEIALDGASRYIALDNGETSATDAFSTDGLLKKFDLKVLDDDKKFFPPYYPFPLMTTEAYEEFPEIVPLMNKLGSILTDDVMMELNYKVDELHLKPTVVAREFLLSQGFLD